MVIGLNAAFEVISRCKNLRLELHEKSEVFRIGLRNIGINVTGETHIVSVIGGHEKNTEILRDLLEERHIFGSTFIHPATPREASLIRFSMNTEISYDNIQYVLSVFEEILPKIQFCTVRNTA